MNPGVPIGSVLAGKYRVEEILGVGGMGVVVLATHIHLEQRFAIKLLRAEAMADTDAVARFVREARAAAMIRSDNVVRVHDVARLDDGTPFMVMEYIEGSDLRGVLEIEGRLAYAQAVAFMLQACEALAETHAVGIIHHDLKPENIYLAKTSDDSLKVKLLDFGISKISFEENGAAQPHHGTPAYMAPEQMVANPTSDARSDIWSLGVILHELLSGALPFNGSTVEEQCSSVVSDPPPVLPAAIAPPELAAVIAKCLEKNPANRFPNATELARALAPLIGADSAVARIERVMLAASRPNTGPRRAVEAAHRAHAATVVVPRRQASSPTGRLLVVFAGLALAGVILVIAALLLRDRSVATARTATAAAGSSSVVVATLLPAADSSSAAASSEPAPVGSTGGGPIAAAPDTKAAPASTADVSPPAAPARPPSPRGPATSDARRAPVAAPAPPTGGDRFGTRK